jgi:group I intron endonuclease
MIIYKVTNKVTGECYIGQTEYTLEKRWKQHCCTSNKCVRLRNAIQKYGQNNFSIEIVAEYRNREDLDNAENYFIDYFNCLSPNGYNLKTGGGNGKHSEESRKKISVARTGIVFSGETLKRMSVSASKRIATKETRVKIGNAGRGKKRSEISRKKIYLMLKKEKKATGLENQARGEGLFCV